MARQKAGRDIETYAHAGKERVNNPPVGLVTPETDRDGWAKDLRPRSASRPAAFLGRQGGATRRSRCRPSRCTSTSASTRAPLSRRCASGEGSDPAAIAVRGCRKRTPPLRQAIEFYKHRHNWKNRLIAGDSLLVMNSLLEKEGLGGRIQTVYIDPPYGIRYGSNFQPFVGRREVTDGKDDDLTGEPEQIRAFRDTWELGIHSYLAYLRDRLLLAARASARERKLLRADRRRERPPRRRMVMDEVFGAGNRMATISYATTGGSSDEPPCRK